MNVFNRDDGKEIRIVPGYRERVLSERISFSPRPDWTEPQYAVAAGRQIARTQQLVDQYLHAGGRFENARVLDVGCGDAISCLLIAAQHPVEQVIGIDLELPLVDEGERHERIRQLASAVCRQVGIDEGVDRLQRHLPLHLEKMDATKLTLADGSVDFLRSRSALEHITPAAQAISEMGRVVRPGGLLQLSIDPFYWPRGCHKRGVVDIPWAHARLSADEYHRFVLESEGERRARSRSQRLATLNHYTLDQWRTIVTSGPFDVLEWHEDPAKLAIEMLGDYPEVADTLRPEVSTRDLTHSRIKTWLRRQ